MSGFLAMALMVGLDTTDAESNQQGLNLWKIAPAWWLYLCTDFESHTLIYGNLSYLINQVQ
jgi:hypothetical protein